MRRRSVDSAAVRAAVPSRDVDEDAGCRRVLDDRPQRVLCAQLAGGTTPAVVHHMWSECRVGVLMVEVPRSDEELEALGIGLRPSDVLVHVAAADPLGSGSDADLIAAAVVTRGGPGRVGAVSVVVAGLLAVEPAGIRPRWRDVDVNRVPPVVVVVGGAAVPAAVVRLEGVVRPPDAGVLVADHDPGPVEAQGPHVGRFDLVDARLDRLGRVALTSLGSEPVRPGVGFDHAHIGASRQRFDVGPITVRKDDVCHVVRSIRDVSRLEHRADRSLGAGGVPLERSVDVPAAGIVLHPVGPRQIGLIVQQDRERGLFSVGRVAQHTVRDLEPDRLGITAGRATLSERQGKRHDNERKEGQKLDSTNRTHSNSPPRVLDARENRIFGPCVQIFSFRRSRRAPPERLIATGRRRRCRRTGTC